MVSCDIKHSLCYSTSTSSYQNYFDFEWFRKYKFIGKHNGYSDVVRILQKILKLVFGCLRQEGQLLVIFTNNSNNWQWITMSEK